MNESNHTKSNTLHNFLLGRGYTAGQEQHFGATIATYYRIDREKDVPDCISNDKPPQFAIRESAIALESGEYRTVDIGICNEAPQGWINFKFYSLKEADLIERIDELEVALLKVWTVLFEATQ